MRDNPEQWSHPHESFHPQDEFAERRMSVRNTAVVSHALLGWKSDDIFHHCRTMLSDISFGGCLAIAEEAPPESTPIVICLDSGMLSVWYDVTVLEARRIGLRTWKLRLGFPETCPYPLYMAVAFGIVNKASDQQVELPRFQPETTTPPKKAPPDKSYRFWERG